VFSAAEPTIRKRETVGCSFFLGGGSAAAAPGGKAQREKSGKKNAYLK